MANVVVKCWLSSMLGNTRFLSNKNDSVFKDKSNEQVVLKPEGNVTKSYSFTIPKNIQMQEK